MIITGIDKKDDKSFKLYIDYEYYGLVYYGDIKKMSLNINNEIDIEIVEFLNKLFYKRAFNKSIKLLSKKEICSFDLCLKLKEKGYNLSVIDRVIDKLQDYGYVDDERYSYTYVRSYLSNKSVSSIRRDLLGKGINCEYIDASIDEVSNDYCDGSVSIDQCNIINILKKKYCNIDINNTKEMNRMFNFMFRRGFSYNDVKKCIIKINNL